MASHDDLTLSMAEARPERRGFGERPLAQTVRAAVSLRRISALLLSLEHEHGVVEEMIMRFAEWEKALSATVPPDPRPRIGEEQGDDRRVYLDHAFDIGAFNPHFPEYDFREFDAETASGTVDFPLAYEGPPGLVHGGFLALFFDCVIQHHSCAVGVAGKTRLLSIRYRRPTPLSTTLDFHIVRRETDGGLVSEARLEHEGEVLCVAELEAVAMRIDRLDTTRYGGRR